jgi:hypothetical protein
MIREITISFSEDVSDSLGTDDIEILNLNTGQVIARSAISLTYDHANGLGRLAFPGLLGGSLPDGNYYVTVGGSGVTDAAGNWLDGNANGVGGGDYHFTFFRYFGDADGDRDVDSLDMLRMRATYLQTSNSPKYNAVFDSDNDGDVDSLDMLRLRVNYLQILDPVAPPSPQEVAEQPPRPLVQAVIETPVSPTPDVPTTPAEPDPVSVPTSTETDTTVAANQLPQEPVNTPTPAPAPTPEVPAPPTEPEPSPVPPPAEPEPSPVPVSSDTNAPAAADQSGQEPAPAPAPTPEVPATPTEPEPSPVPTSTESDPAAAADVPVVTIAAEEQAPVDTPAATDEVTEPQESAASPVVQDPEIAPVTEAPASAAVVTAPAGIAATIAPLEQAAAPSSPLLAGLTVDLMALPQAPLSRTVAPVRVGTVPVIDSLAVVGCELLLQPQARPVPEVTYVGADAATDESAPINEMTVLQQESGLASPSPETTWSPMEPLASLPAPSMVLDSAMPDEALALLTEWNER